MRKLLFLASLLVAGCAAGGDEPPRLTEKQAARLEATLAGKVAGDPVSCVSRYPQSDLRVISDGVLLYRVSSRLIYRNDLIGSCNGLSRGDTLVVSTFGSQYCRGDMAKSADLVSGMITGACALGSFTPYRTPGR
ncbi:MAG TPA: hypothetical protein VJM09_10420 [Sphingobium sp.]|nr:hypothetical protein [Sphingobium sp.]